MSKEEAQKLVLEALTELLHRHQDDPVKCNQINDLIAQIRKNPDLFIFES